MIDKDIREGLNTRDSLVMKMAKNEIEIDEEKKVLSKYGSSDSGASLGDILGDALNKKKSE